MMVRVSLLLVVLALLLAFPANSSASSDSFINIVNPVRVSSSVNLVESVQTQYHELAIRNLPATWLLTYDVLSEPDMAAEFKQMDKEQELGVFMEVSPEFASRSGVLYHQSDSWHRSKSLFSIGYFQKDRKRLIDTLFDKFKNTFGVYPKSVGAWWIDSYSLEYMQQKYGVVANLGLSDQLYTDSYNVWGQLWEVPFYPSILHAGVPASSKDTKIDIVNIQWAPRDPLNGYSADRASLYSTQDYPIIGLKDDFFAKLIDLYGQSEFNNFGQVTVGLEGGLTPSIYQNFYARQMEIIKEKREKGFRIITMSEFSNWYKNKFPGLSPESIITTQDLVGKKIRTLWYQSPFYRINVVEDLTSGEVKISDLRFYFSDFEEPFYLYPNDQMDLFIQIPSVIDSAWSKNSAWQVSRSGIAKIEKDGQNLNIKLKDGSMIIFDPTKITLPGNITNIPKTIAEDSQIRIAGQDSREISAGSKWLAPPEGLTYKSLFLEKPDFFKRKKRTAVGVALTTLLAGVFYFYYLKFPGKRRLMIMTVIIALTGFYGFRQVFADKYYVSQAEVDALAKLSTLPTGRVLVYNNDCYKCHWSSLNKPAAVANLKDYVEQLSHKQIVYNSLIFKTLSREEGKKELQRTGAEYIYLTKYDDNIERLPFSPGDYGVEKIYENANAELWRVI